ncbi:MAG: histidine phosphatase family protein [Saprospiraceae bacterium]
MRHAKSSWANFSLKDFDRPLDERGKSDGPLMAERLKSIVPNLDILIASPAVRTTQTAEYVSNTYNTDIQFNSQLYHGVPEAYLDALQDLDENCQNVILFGHNPGITEIANMVSKSIIDNIPTCGIIITNTHASWSNISFQDLTLEHIITPKNAEF